MTDTNTDTGVDTGPASLKALLSSGLYAGWYAISRSVLLIGAFYAILPYLTNGSLVEVGPIDAITNPYQLWHFITTTETGIVPPAMLLVTILLLYIGLIMVVITPILVGWVAVLERTRSVIN